MAVYVDAPIWPWRGLMMCHLLADSPEELHAMAQRLGLPRSRFQCPPHTRTPHYDIDEARRAQAIALGAIAVGRKQIVQAAQRSRVWWHAQANHQIRD